MSIKENDMIKSIRIINFKSIAAMTLELGPFNCLVGMNGAGKSTVLQAFDFLSHLMLGDMDAWLASLRIELLIPSDFVIKGMNACMSGEKTSANLLQEVMRHPVTLRQV